MKKIFNSFIAVCSLIFISCGDYQIPQSVSIKTDADYNFSVGSIEQDLSSFLNIKTISEKLNSSISKGNKNAFSSFSVYDYRPPLTDSGTQSQKFLAEVKLQEIPVDISEYLSNMDISTALTEQSFEQEFTIPSLSVDSLSSYIDLPDFNDIISEKAEIGLPPNLEIIIPGNLNAEIDPFTIDINVTSPEFSSISFYEGNLQVSIITDEEVYGSTVDAKLELLDSDGNLVSQASNTITNQATFPLPIAGKTLKPNMKLKLSGKQSGGKDLNFPEYKIRCIFSAIKIKEIIGLKMDLGEQGNLAVDQKVYIGTDDTFVSCVIGEGSLSAIAKIPETWTGVSSDSDLIIEGALKKSDGSAITESDFDKSQENPPYILNRTLNLQGHTFSKESEAINVKGTVKIKLDDVNGANIYLEQDTTGLNKIKVDTKCLITEIQNITIDTAKAGIQDKLSFKDEQPLPPEIKTYVDNIILTKAGIEGTYTNTLPPGNDFTAEFSSNFLFSSPTPKSQVFSNGENLPLSEELVDTTDNTIKFSDSSKIDYALQIKLPGATSEHPEYAQFKKVKIGETYKIAINIKPVFDWKSITINTAASGIQLDQTIETDFNLSAMFKDISSSFGDDDFFKKIELTQMPLYLYFSCPSQLDVLKNIKYKGLLKFVCGTEKLYVVGSEENGKEKDGTLQFITNQPLEFKDSSEESQIVTSNISNFPSSYSGDVADMVNSTKHVQDSKLTIEYCLRISDSADEEKSQITISKDDFDKIKDDKSPSTISIFARIIIPLEIKITEQIDLNINKLANLNEDTDIFNRTEAPDLSEIMKYAQIVESMSVSYNSENKFFNYQNDSSKSLQFIFNTGMTNLTTNVYGEKGDLNLKNGTIKIVYEDIKKILEQYPFTPKMTVRLPEGNVYLPQDPCIKINCNVGLSTNGTVKLFGE
ncbi:MAG: hypothetical protein MR555_01260 [Spirochaetia bacterium]|nr:hypothetical protein [Spirochaetia bacterium]